MPIYRYECGGCNAKYQGERSISEMDDVECPKCGSKEQERIIFPVASIRGKVAERLISVAEAEAKYGKDWRETPVSRRITADEPEKIYLLPDRKK